MIPTFAAYTNEYLVIHRYYLVSDWMAVFGLQNQTKSTVTVNFGLGLRIVAFFVVESHSSHIFRS